MKALETRLYLASLLSSIVEPESVTQVCVKLTLMVVLLEVISREPFKREVSCSVSLDQHFPSTCPRIFWLQNVLVQTPELMFSSSGGWVSSLNFLSLILIARK